MGPDDLDRVNDMLQRYKGDPWKRTQQELQFTLNKSKQEMPDQAQRYVISRRQFERWWSLILEDFLNYLPPLRFGQFEYIFCH